MNHFGVNSESVRNEPVNNSVNGAYIDVSKLCILHKVYLTPSRLRRTPPKFYYAKFRGRATYAFANVTVPLFFTEKEGEPRRAHE